MSARDQSKKRKREGEREKATVGQLTSGIKNKQVRSEQYGRLRHKAKVRLSCLRIAVEHFTGMCSEKQATEALPVTNLTVAPKRYLLICDPACCTSRAMSDTIAHVAYRRKSMLSARSGRRSS
jgi:hypothetical protein